MSPGWPRREGGRGVNPYIHKSVTDGCYSPPWGALTLDSSLYMCMYSITPLHPWPVTSLPRRRCSLDGEGLPSVGVDRHRRPVHGLLKRGQDARAGHHATRTVSSVTSQLMVHRVSVHLRSGEREREPVFSNQVNKAQCCAPGDHTRSYGMRVHKTLQGCYQGLIRVKKRQFTSLY